MASNGAGCEDNGDGLSCADTRSALTTARSSEAEMFRGSDAAISLVSFQVCFRKASMASPLENDEEGVSLEARYLTKYCS